jgi:hypothetical protein
VTFFRRDNDPDRPDHKTTRQLKRIRAAARKRLQQLNRIKRLQGLGAQFTPAKTLTRLCPNCGETITYKSVKERNRHEKAETLCRSCTRTRVNKKIGANPYKRSARSRQLPKHVRDRLAYLLKRLTDDAEEYEHIRRLAQEAEWAPKRKELLDRLLRRNRVDEEHLRNLLG